MLAGIGWDHRERQPIQEVEMEEVPRTLLKLQTERGGYIPNYPVPLETKEQSHDEEW